MKIILNKKKLIKILDNEENLGFVPTMGALHRGHTYLIKKSILDNKKTIFSIFINKPQFNLKVDYVFIPKNNDIYPEKVIKKIKINSFKKKLCGKFRPNHFEAVVDVVSRFVKLIKPKRIYFGEKDMQQLILIEDYFKKKNLKTKVVRCKTIRQENGVAYSSRNLHLNSKSQIIASKIYKLLIKNKKKIILNKNYLNHIKLKILNLGVKKIDYLSILDLNKIIKPYKKKNKKKIFISYYLDSTRLIDNI